MVKKQKDGIGNINIESKKMLEMAKTVKAISVPIKDIKSIK